MGQRVAIGVQHLGHAGNLRGSGGGGTGMATGHQHVHVAAAFQRGGDGVQGSALDGGVVVFSNYKSSHVDSLDDFGFILQLGNQRRHVRPP